MVAYVLKAEVDLCTDDDSQLLKLGGQLYCKLQHDASLMLVVFLVDLISETTILENTLQGRTERKLIETIQSSRRVSQVGLVVVHPKPNGVLFFDSEVSEVFNK